MPPNLLYYISHDVNSTIFKTITDEVTGATKSLSIFGSTFSQMSKNIANGQGIFYSIFQGDKFKPSDIEGINGYINAIKGGKEHLDAFNQNMKNCSVAAQKYVNDAQEAGKTTEEMSKEISELPKAASAGSIALKGLRVALSTIASIGISMAINAIISGITNLVNSAVNAYEDGIEKVKTLNDELTELETEVDNVNSELEETRAKLAELEKIKSPNLFEQEQIDNLREYNDELERQAKLLEYEQESKRKEIDTAAREEAINTLVPSTMGLYTETDDVWGWLGAKLFGNLTMGFNLLQGNTAPQLSQYLDDFKQQTEEYNQVQEELNKAIENGADQSIRDDLNNKVTQYETKIANMRSEIQDRMSDANQMLLALNPDDARNQPFIEFYNAFIDKADELLGSAEKLNFSDVFESIDFKDTTDKLKELYKQGKLTEETFGNVEGIDDFTEALEEVCGEGASVETIVSSIISYLNDLSASSDNAANSLSAVAESLANITESASGIIENAQTIQEAIHKMADGDYLSYDEMIELLEIDPSLADNFTRTAQGYKIAVDSLLDSRSKYIEANKESVESDLNTAQADVDNYREQISELEKQKQKYEYELQRIEDAKKAREESGYNNLSEDVKAQFKESITASSNDSDYVELITNEEYAAEKAEEIEDLIKQTETSIDLANGNLEDSVNLVSAIKLVLDQISNPFDEQAKSLSDVLSELSSQKDLIDSVYDEIEENGAISLSTLQKISDTYPEMESAVANYMMGLVDEKTVLKELEEQYKKIEYEYRESVVAKLNLNQEELNNYINYLNTKVADSTDYYESIGALDSKFVDYMAENYSVDLQNCMTWAKAKERIIDEMKTRVFGAEDLYDFETMTYKSGWTDFVQNNTNHTIESVQSIFESYEQAVNEFGARAFVFDKASNFSGLGSSSSTDSSSSSFFDWVQVKLEKLKTITSNFIDSITETISKKQSESYINKALKSVSDEKKANQQAIQTYTAEANKIGLSADWIRKIQNGDYSLDEVTDSDLADKIQKYQEFWDKIEDCKQSIKDLTQQEEELIIQSEDLNLDDYEYKANRKSYAVSVAEGKITTKELAGKKVTATDYNNVNKALSDEISAIRAQIGYAQYLQTKYDPTSERYKELQEIIESGSEAIKENTDAILENNNKKFEIKIADYERSAEEYSRKVDNKENDIALKEAQGKNIKASDYNYLINQTTQENKVLANKLDALYSQRSKVEYGSDEWDDLTSQIEETENAINDNTIAIEGWKDTIAEMKIADYEDTAHTYARKAELKQTQIEVLEAKGKKVGTSAYQYMIDNTEKENDTLRLQREVIKQAQSKTEVGSDKWKEYQEQLETLNDTIYDNTIAIEGWKDTIIQMNIQKYSDTADKYARNVEIKQNQID